MPLPAAPPLTPAVPQRRVVVVLGMHRSGTSLVAGCLQRLGVDFGPRLMPPNADNPRGYFEHNDVVNLHDRLLLALDRSWDEPTPFPPRWWLDVARLEPYRRQVLDVLHRDFPTAPLWGLKDPRLCLLLPWWETIWPETGSRPLFVLVRRRAAEVAASLARREGMSAARASLLWLRYTLAAERETRAHQRVLVDFGDFLADENTALAPVRQALGLPASAEVGGTRLVDPDLGRSAADHPPGETFPWIARAEDALLQGQRGDDARMRTELDLISQELSAGQALLLRAPAEELKDVARQLEMSRRQARWYEEEWQKARAKAEKLKSKLEAAQGKSAKVNESIS